MDRKGQKFFRLIAPQSGDLTSGHIQPRQLQVSAKNKRNFPSRHLYFSSLPAGLPVAGTRINGFCLMLFTRESRR